MAALVRPVFRIVSVMFVALKGSGSCMTHMTDLGVCVCVFKI